MRRAYRDSIDFPANPFVAFADFILMILVLVTLGFIYQNVYNDEVIQRLAVQRLQGLLQKDFYGGLDDGQRRFAIEKFKDGDLQRFTFDGAYLYNKGVNEESSKLNNSGRMLLVKFGKVLHEYEGDSTRPGYGLFKRISIQGNCDKSEGDDDTLWKISQARAREVAEIFQRDCKINPELIEATGRGSWDKSTLSSDMLKNRRLDIVVYYSGARAVEFEKKIQSQQILR
jgi:hypothetical protein